MTMYKKRKENTPTIYLAALRDIIPRKQDVSILFLVQNSWMF